MQILLNGQKREIPDGLNVSDLLRHLDIKPERVAVEINEEIVRKVTYGEVLVKENDRVEVVQFMGGGAFGSAECEVRSAECGVKNGCFRYYSLVSGLLSLVSLFLRREPWKRNRS